MKTQIIKLSVTYITVALLISAIITMLNAFTNESNIYLMVSTLCVIIMSAVMLLESFTYIFDCSRIELFKYVSETPVNNYIVKISESEVEKTADGVEEPVRDIEKPKPRKTSDATKKNTKNTKNTRASKTKEASGVKVSRKTKGAKGV